MAQTLETKGLPSDTIAEQMILGSMLQDAELLHAARPVLTEDDFSLMSHKQIFRRAAGLYDAGQPVDRITVYSALKDHNEDTTFSFLNSLEEGLPILPSLDGYIRIVKDKAFLRNIITATSSLVRECFTGTETAQGAFGKLHSLVRGLENKQSRSSLGSAKELVEEHGLEKLLAPRKQSGLEFPWSWMNYFTSGMLPGELWVLAGTTSSGKTSAAIQHAVHAARRGSGVAIFSLEVTSEALFQKACYQLAMVDSERGKRGKLTADERKVLRKAAEELAELPLYFDTHSITAVAIYDSLRRCKIRHKVDHVVVDYLQLLGNIDRYPTRAQAVGANAWAMKMMAADFKVPVLLLSQFSRQKETDQNAEPQLSWLKESGDIENHANGVWFLHRTSQEDSDQIPVKFMLPKQRDGRRNIRHDFYFMPKYQRFEAASNADYD